MFKYVFCNGKGTALVDSLDGVPELQPGPLGELRNMGYTGLEQNTGHCD